MVAGLLHVLQIAFSKVGSLFCPPVQSVSKTSKVVPLCQKEPPQLDPLSNTEDISFVSQFWHVNVYVVLSIVPLSNFPSLRDYLEFDLLARYV